MKIQYPSMPPREPDKSILKTVKNWLDPKIGLWMTHDPAIYKEPVSGYYYIYCTGAVCRRSKDLIHWELVGKVVGEPPKESVDWTKSTDIWAPDIVKVGEEYRLYGSNSSWGVQQSCIFLAVSNHPEGPFLPRGCVLKTSSKLPVNAIDANIITDAKTGEQYMLYGSFWGGCHVLLLDKETGLAAEEGIGTCVACRPSWMSGAIEGPYMIYQEETGYYYLFVSYGSLKSDYHIRVGRSRDIRGPFLDYHGKMLTDTEDQDNMIGYLALCGYRWNDGKAYMAPGHNSVLQDDDGQWYLVCHVREQNFRDEPEPSTLQIRKMYWSKDGWPMVSAQPYSGEQEQEIPKDALEGFYECIRLAPSQPQGIQSSVPMKLGKDGYYECCSIQGAWQYHDNILTVSYGSHKEYLRASVLWDWELWKPTIGFTGTNEKGIAVWAKKVEA